MDIFGWRVMRKSEEEVVNQAVLTETEVRTLLQGAGISFDRVVQRAKANMRRWHAKAIELQQLAGHCRQSANDEFAQAMQVAQANLNQALAEADEMDETAAEQDLRAANMNAVFELLGLNDPEEEQSA